MIVLGPSNDQITHEHMHLVVSVSVHDLVHELEELVPSLTVPMRIMHCVIG